MQLPKITPRSPFFVLDQKALDAARNATLAALMTIQEKIRALSTSIELIKESSKPGWITLHTANSSTFTGALQQQHSPSPPIEAQIVKVGRSTIKPPFWQKCDSEHLRDVIRRVFHGLV